MFLLAGIMIITAVNAQRGRVTAASAFIDNGDLATAREHLEAAFVHEKSKGWPRTYIVAARLAIAEFRSSTDPKKIIEAGRHFMKATELDQKGDEKGRNIGRFSNEIKMALTFFMPDLQNAGIEAFNRNDYQLALDAFSMVVNLNLLPIFAEDNLPADSVFIYYSGIAATRVQDWAKAETYFNKAIDLRYAGGDPVLLLHDVFINSNDSAKIIPNLKRGFELFPNDERILTSLINHFLQTGQNREALVYLETAIQNDPNNHSFFYARGVLYDWEKDFDNALKFYNKALEIKPDYFEPTLNIGVIHYNRAVEQMEVANAISDFRQFEVARLKAEELFRKSLPYIEKAHEIRPDDKMVLETLRGLYYRFNMMDKFEVVDAKYRSLTGN